MLDERVKEWGNGKVLYFMQLFLDYIPSDKKFIG